MSGLDSARPDIKKKSFFVLHFGKLPKKQTKADIIFLTY